MSRRLLAAATLLIVVASAVLLLGGPSDDASDGTYRVRAIFDNAFAVVPGDEVRVAGARVGTVDATDVDDARRAVLVLKIDDAAFRDFRSDAECTVRPRSNIGERHVECVPSQPRGIGSALAPPLREVTVDGQRQRLLPVERTGKSIDLDLVVGTNRLPESQRTAILLNELGVGLAARGGALRRAVRAALPGLRETDRVLEILDGQNVRLRALAADGDRALRPLADTRAELGRVVGRAAEVQTAVQERRSALDADLRRLPAALGQLEPTARELSRLARQGAPAVLDLRRTAPAGTRVLDALGPFGTAAIEPARELGETADRARSALLAADPTIRRLGRTASAARPTLRQARALTTSLRETGGFERLLDGVYFQVLAINAYDDVGHYLRVNATISPCSVYATTPLAGCSARFGAGAGTRAAAGNAPRAGETPEATLSRRVLSGESAASVLEDAEGRPRYRGLLRRLDDLATRRARSGTARTGPAVRGSDAPIDLEDDPVAGLTRPPDEASRVLRALLGAGD